MSLTVFDLYIIYLNAYQYIVITMNVYYRKGNIHSYDNYISSISQTISLLLKRHFLHFIYTRSELTITQYIHMHTFRTITYSKHT